MIDDEQVLKKIGERLKQLRIEKGYSNYENFAFKNDISRAQYGRYETGENMKLLNLIKVLKALDVSLNEFFNEEFK